MKPRAYRIFYGGGHGDLYFEMMAYDARDAITQAELRLKIGYSRQDYIRRVEPVPYVSRWKRFIDKILRRSK